MNTYYVIDFETSKKIRVSTEEWVDRWSSLLWLYTLILHHVVLKVDHPFQKSKDAKKE